jgi:hypothetical protein
LPEDKAILPRICESIRLGLARPDDCGEEGCGEGETKAQSSARTSLNVVVVILATNSPTEDSILRTSDEGNTGKAQTYHFWENLWLRF